MKKIFKISVILLVLAAMALALASCGEKEQDGAKQLIGTWAQSNNDSTVYTVEFKEDNTLNASKNGISFAGTYEVNGDQITLNIDGQGSETITYKIKGNVMTVTTAKGSTEEWKKQ